MIKLKRISFMEFKLSILTCTNDIKWFFDIITKDTNKNIYYKIECNNNEVGLLVNYLTIAPNEFGLCIFEEFKKKGFGEKIVNYLVQKSYGRAMFSINKFNTNAQFFFNTLLKRGILNNCNIKTV